MRRSASIGVRVTGSPRRSEGCCHRCHAQPPSTPRKTRYIVTAMARWEGDEVKVELPRVVEAHVRIVGGEVAITAAAGPAKVDAKVVNGDPLEVEVDSGVLTVVHEPERWIGGLGAVGVI